MSTEPIRWLRHGCGPKGTEFRLGRRRDEVFGEWIGVALLRANLRGTWSTLSVAPGLDRVAVQESLRLAISALLSHLQGGMSLHASGVSRAGVGVLFLGDTCAGKSTIAAQLCEFSEVELLSDDAAGLLFDGPQVQIAPTEVIHSLRPDIAQTFGLDVLSGGKVLSHPARVAAQPSRLGALVVLEFDDCVELPILRRMRGVAAFAALNRALVRFALDEPEILRRELDQFARIAAEAPFYELVRPRKLSALPASAYEAERVLDSLSDCRSGA